MSKKLETLDEKKMTPAIKLGQRINRMLRNQRSVAKSNEVDARRAAKTAGLPLLYTHVCDVYEIDFQFKTLTKKYKCETMR